MIDLMSPQFPLPSHLPIIESEPTTSLSDQGIRAGPTGKSQVLFLELIRPKFRKRLQVIKTDTNLTQLLMFLLV